MPTRKLLWTGVAAAALGSFALPAAARGHVDFYLNFGPPAAPYEVVPAPRAGFFWVPGFWEWRGHRHVWIRGHWVRERPGYYYVAPAWVPYGARWYWRPGGWHRHGYAYAYRW